MQLRSIVEILDTIAPLGGAEAWDNVGLLLGDPNASVSKVLMAIDATPAVLAEAQRVGAELLVAYHPPVFKPVKQIVAPQPLFVAAHNGIALYSPHTALDAAAGGTNDVLADAVGLSQRSALIPCVKAAGHFKLVFFVPASDVAAVLDALFEAGAGRMGPYSRCSYQSAGTGSFFPQAEAQPVHGRVGAQSCVNEQRVEVLVPKKAAGQVIAALLASHPYETPAFDLLALADTPHTHGQGRIGRLPEHAACDAQTLASRVARAMRAEHVMLAPARGVDPATPLRRIAVQAGAGDSMLSEAIAQGAEVFVTGELRHHTVLAALAQNVTVITLTHDGSERAALVPYAEALRARAPHLDVRQSSADTSPWQRPPQNMDTRG